MPIKVDHPVLGPLEFADEMTMEQIDRELLSIGASVLPEDSSLDVFLNQGYEGLTSTIRGIGQMIGVSEESQAAYIDEFENRVQLEQNPVAGYTGLIAGSLLDPVTLPVAFLKPIAVGGKVATGLARGAVAGGIGGFIEPTYEEFGDSTLLNVGAGVGLGGAIGAAVGKFAPRALGIDEPTPQSPEPQEPFVGPQQIVDQPPRPFVGPQPRPPFVGPQQIVDQPSLPVIQGPTFTPVQARKIALGQVRANLQERSKFRLEQKQIGKINKTISNLQKEMDRVQGERIPLETTGKGKKKKFQQAPSKQKMRKRLEHLARLEQRIEAEKLKIRAHEQAVQARTELRALDQNKLTPFGMASISQRTQQLLGGAEPEVKKVATPVVDNVTPEVTPDLPKKPVAEAVEPTPQPTEGGLPTGLADDFGAKQSVGAARVSPKGMLMPEAEAGVDQEALSRSVNASRAKTTPEEDRRASQGFDRTETERTRETLRERATSVQLSNLLNGGKLTQFTTETISEAEALEKQIGEEYDNLLEWAYETWQRKQSFNAPEQLVLDKLVRASDQLIQDSAKKIRAFKRRGEQYSDESIKAFQDLQLAGLVLNIDKANRANTGRALQIMRVTNERRKGIWKDYSSGKRKSAEVMLMGAC